MEAAGARGRHGDAAVRYGGGGLTQSPRTRPNVRRPAGSKPRGGRLGTVLRLRAGAGLGGRIPPLPPPAPCSAGRSVTRTEVECSRQWGQVRRGPERPAAGGKGPRGAADRTHEKARFPGGALGVQSVDALPALYLPACSRQTSFFLGSQDGGPDRRHQPDSQLPGGQEEEIRTQSRRGTTCEDAGRSLQAREEPALLTP
ncbi:uncharacterized protein LOC112581656 isoform X1 [Bubalus bubalis]|uniref:uncharacterized protein LOC112581656 isoform X1 n=1 Tax=Bubalus bubalis TaxID=89462 RepID=UPI001E1B8803|nr:uncharacterized protein LOC112581656 isoform X1 [Bubalus bubalis]